MDKALVFWNNLNFPQIYQRHIIAISPNKLSGKWKEDWLAALKPKPKTFQTLNEWKLRSSREMQKEQCKMQKIESNCNFQLLHFLAISVSKIKCTIEQLRNWATMVRKKWVIFGSGLFLTLIQYLYMGRTPLTALRCQDKSKCIFEPPKKSLNLKLRIKPCNYHTKANFLKCRQMDQFAN